MFGRNHYGSMDLVDFAELFVFRTQPKWTDGFERDEPLVLPGGDAPDLPDRLTSSDSLVEK